MIEKVVTVLAQRIKDKLPELKHVGYYQHNQALETPCALIHLVDMSEAPASGDDEIKLDVSIEVYCVLSRQTPQVELEVYGFAAEVMKLLADPKAIDLNAVTKPRNVQSYEGTLNADGDQGYESAVVMFQATVDVTESTWDAEGVIPSIVKASVAPDIGKAHEEDYCDIVS